MTQLGVSILPIVENSKLIGVVWRIDILRRIFGTCEPEND